MKGLASEWVWLNGRFCRAATAHLSVFDRGFLYGDGIFETLRVYDGRPFGLDLHLQRLKRSARVLGIRLPVVDWPTVVHELIRRQPQRELAVRLTVTRGSGRGLLPPRRLEATVLIFATPIDRRVPRWQGRGVAAVSVPYSRLGLSEHKHLGYLPAVMAKRAAAQRHAVEGLFVDAAGRVLEGATSNLFVRLGRRWITPPATDVLPGVTRGLVSELMAAQGLRVVERRVRLAEVADADEAFLTSSIAEILPLCEIDGVAIGDGRPGPQTLSLSQAYRQSIDLTLRSPLFR